MGCSPVIPALGGGGGVGWGGGSEIQDPLLSSRPAWEGGRGWGRKGGRRGRRSGGGGGETFYPSPLIPDLKTELEE